MTIRDNFHSTGHGRIYEYTKIADRIAQSRTTADIFQTESLHRREHKCSSPTIASSIEKKI